MRAALDAWREKYGDMGDIDEVQMVRTWYPDGSSPTTNNPLLIAISPNQFGRQPASGGGQYKAPVLVQMHCATQGASIIWTDQAGDEARWQLYTEPVRLDKSGRHLLLRQSPPHRLPTQRRTRRGVSCGVTWIPLETWARSSPGRASLRASPGVPGRFTSR